MASKPDFIVDPAGRAQDVRRAKYSGATWSSPPPSPPRPPGPKSPPKPVPSASQKRTGSPSVVMVPIGLILSAVIAVIRLLIGARIDPGYAEEDVSRLNQAMMHYVDGDYDMALININMVIRSDPDFAEAYNRRAIVYQAQGRYDRAIEDLNRVIEMLPEWSPGYNNRGSAYYGQGAYDQAIADLDRAIALDANSAKAYFNRGLVHAAQNDYETAIADLSEAIRLSEESPMAPINRLPVDSNTPAPFSTDYWSMFRTDVSLPVAYAYRGLLYLGTDQLDRWSADMERAQELGLDSAFVQQNRTLDPMMAFEH